MSSFFVLVQAQPFPEHLRYAGWVGGVPDCRYGPHDSNAPRFREGGGLGGGGGGGNVKGCGGSVWPVLHTVHRRRPYALVKCICWNSVGNASALWTADAEHHSVSAGRGTSGLDSFLWILHKDSFGATVVLSLLVSPDEGLWVSTRACLIALV